MKTLSTSQQSSAARRSLLVGLTLAEIMLVLLFALLLLLGGVDEDRAKERWELAAGESLKSALVSAGVLEDKEFEEPLGTPALDSFESLMLSVSRLKRDSESISDSWARIGQSLQSPNEQVQQLENALDEAQMEIASLQQKMAQMREQEDAFKSMQDYAQALIKQIDDLQGGAPPPCFYRPAPLGSGKLRGSSMPLGVVRIKVDALVIESIYVKQLNEPLVDFFSREADRAGVLQVVGEWPIGKVLSIGEFGEVSEPIKVLADSETVGHRKCMFTMDYIMDDYAPLTMFTDVFQKYFLPQNRLSSNG